MADLQPPPTYALPVLVIQRPDPRTGKLVDQSQFNPIWLKWFLDLAETLNSLGGLTPEHNLLSFIQGGTANQYYHFTQAQHADLTDGGATTLHSHVIADDSVTNAMLAEMPASTLKGNDTAGAANPQDLTVAEVKTLLAYTLSPSYVVPTTLTVVTGTLSAGTVDNLA